MIISDFEELPLNTAKSVLAFGHFNTIHPGHIRYLKHAKEQGELLFIALRGDQDKDIKYQFTQKDRAESLNLLSIADYIFCLRNDELGELIEKLKPSKLVFGNEFQKTKDPNINKAIEIQTKNNSLTLFHAGDINYASTDLLSGSEFELIEKRKIQFLNALERQKINKSCLLNSIEEWKSSRLIVVGETILDQYAACEAVGLSAEAPVLVVKELAKKNYIGGAAIVAQHIKALGASCDFISVVGQDENAKIVRDYLDSEGVNYEIITDPSRPTIFKKRYVVENQKLFRVSHLEDHSLNKEIENELISKIESKAKYADGIIVSDFVYGIITERVLNKIYQLAKRHGLCLFGDLQCSSQVGSITKFKNFSLLCPNEREARIAMQDKDSGLELLCNQLIKITKTQRLIMKLGANGFIAYDRNEQGNLISQSFPALSVNPVDVAGAGDSLLALMSTGLAKKQPMMLTAALGCFITSLAVETMGNVPISHTALKYAVEILFKNK